MVALNHFIGGLVSPMGVSLAIFVVGAVVCRLGRGRLGAAIVGVGVVVLWAFSTPFVAGLLGLGLEREFPPQRAEELPTADAIVVLGGGVIANTNLMPYAELYPAADRAAHAARLWKAGKAPAILVSGKGEREATRTVLLEYGVPDSAIWVEDESLNTEQNAKCVAFYVASHHKSARPPRILLVTSSWHMRRSLLMFRKYTNGLEVVPAASDYEATVTSDQPLEIAAFLPNADSLVHSTALVKEHVGYWGYRLLR